MRPQRRPFTVEVKTRRKPLPLGNFGVLVAEDRHTDDLPVRDIYDDIAVRPGFGPPGGSWAEQPSSVKTLRGLAARVFAAPEPEPQPEVPTSSSLVSGEVSRSGRILPSLMPTAGNEVEEIRVDRKPRRRPIKAANHPQNKQAELTVTLAKGGTGPDEQTTGLGAVPYCGPIQAELRPEGLSAEGAATEADLGPLRLPSHPASAPSKRASKYQHTRKKTGRVPAGERWKRRRLPKALW